MIRRKNIDLKALLLTQAIIVATCLSTFVAAGELAPELLASSPSASSSSSSSCSRALEATLWGGAFAFFSLAADIWCASFYGDGGSDGSVVSVVSIRVMLLILFSPLQPLGGFFILFRQMFLTLRFRQILRSSANPELRPDAMLIRVVVDILVVLFGINQRPGFLKKTRIIASARVVLGVSESTKLQLSDVYTRKRRDNVADALTLGQYSAETSCLIELNEAGKLALLESSILPNYKKLRFLEGRSGIATLIICAQAIGYVTSIVYRAIHHLPMSPIERLGFFFSMLVIVRSVVHSAGTYCQCPLLMYLNPTQEQKILDECKSTRWSVVDDIICDNVAVLGLVVAGSVVAAFTILVERQLSLVEAFMILAECQDDSCGSEVALLGPPIFTASLLAQLLFMITVWCWYWHGEKTWLIAAYWLYVLSLIFGSIGVVLSIVETIDYWQTGKFDNPNPSVILPFVNLPFLG